MLQIASNITQKLGGGGRQRLADGYMSTQNTIFNMARWVVIASYRNWLESGCMRMIRTSKFLWLEVLNKPKSLSKNLQATAMAETGLRLRFVRIGS